MYDFQDTREKIINRYSQYWVQWRLAIPEVKGPTNSFLLADFRYCQYEIRKKMTWKDQGLAFVIGEFPLLLGSRLRGLTVVYEERISEGGQIDTSVD